MNCKYIEPYSDDYMTYVLPIGTEYEQLPIRGSDGAIIGYSVQLKNKRPNIVGKYVLTEKALTEKAGVDLRSRLATDSSIAPETVINNLL